MIEYLYHVTFITGRVETVYAGSEQTAIILAQARQIRKGNNYKVKGILKTSTD